MSGGTGLVAALYFSNERQKTLAGSIARINDLAFPVHASTGQDGYPVQSRSLIMSAAAREVRLRDRPTVPEIDACK